MDLKCSIWQQRPELGWANGKIMVANYDNILLHKHFELSLYKSTSVMWETDTGIQYSNTVHHQINTFQSTSWYTTQAIWQCRQMLLNIRTIQLNSKQYQPMNFVVWINCPCFECDNSSSTSQKIRGCTSYIKKTLVPPIQWTQQDRHCELKRQVSSFHAHFNCSAIHSLLSLNNNWTTVSVQFTTIVVNLSWLLQINARLTTCMITQTG